MVPAIPTARRSARISSTELSAGATWDAGVSLLGSDRTLDMVRGRVVRQGQYTRPLAAAARANSLPHRAPPPAATTATRGRQGLLGGAGTASSRATERATWSTSRFTR